jgi:peptidoglycan hydrolase-like protein with peptidoglycan-binding domain
MADPIIKKGSKGDAVKKAQRALICRYYLWGPGQDDGIFGPVTDLAVRNYQFHRSSGEWHAYSYPLVIDGIVGPATWSRLAPPQVKNGSKGNAVRLLQEILNSFGYPPFNPGPIDAVFGPLTESAVREFQQDYSDCEGNPLAVDGIVGPKTWTALWS